MKLVIFQGGMPHLVAVFLGRDDFDGCFLVFSRCLLFFWGVDYLICFVLSSFDLFSFKELVWVFWVENCWLFIVHHLDSSCYTFVFVSLFLVGKLKITSARLVGRCVCDYLFSQGMNLLGIILLQRCLRICHIDFIILKRIT